MHKITHFKTTWFILVFIVVAGAGCCIFHNTLPSVELLISIAIRLIAAGVAIFIAFKYREFKILFLATMFGLMAIRQFMTLLIWNNFLDKSSLARGISELPGSMVTILTIISMVYLGQILHKKKAIIQTQQKTLDTLSGLLPICAKCKKIRNDDGYWNDIEAFIEAHADIKFSHALCEPCQEELYGNEAWFKKRKEKLKNRQ